jgi:hypothetical protein
MRKWAIGAAIVLVLVLSRFVRTPGPSPVVKPPPTPAPVLGPLSWAVLTPDASMLVTDHLLQGRLWDVKSGNEADSFDVPANPGPGMCVWTYFASRPPIFSHDGRRMVFTHGATPKVFDVLTGEGDGKVPSGIVAFGPEGDSVAVVREGRLQILESGSQAVLAEIRIPIQDPEWRLAWSPGGRWMAFIGRALNVVDISSGKSVMSVAGQPNRFPEGVFKPSSDELWTWSNDLIEVWKVTTGKKVRSHVLPDTLIHSLVITREGRVVLAGTSPSAPKSNLPVHVWTLVE